MDKVGLKGRAQWIALPRGSEDFLTALAGDGIIERHNKRLLTGKLLEQAVSGLVKQGRLVNAVFGVKPVVGSPVEMLGTTGADEITQSASILIEEGREHVLVKALGTGWGCGCGGSRSV